MLSGGYGEGVWLKMGWATDSAVRLAGAPSSSSTCIHVKRREKYVVTLATYCNDVGAREEQRGRHKQRVLWALTLPVATKIEAVHPQIAYAGP